MFLVIISTPQLSQHVQTLLEFSSCPWNARWFHRWIMDVKPGASATVTRNSALPKKISGFAVLRLRNTVFSGYLWRWAWPRLNRAILGAEVSINQFSTIPDPSLSPWSLASMKTENEDEPWTDGSFVFSWISDIYGSPNSAGVLWSVHFCLFSRNTRKNSLQNGVAREVITMNIIPYPHDVITERGENSQGNPALQITTNCPAELSRQQYIYRSGWFCMDVGFSLRCDHLTQLNRNSFREYHE